MVSVCNVSTDSCKKLFLQLGSLICYVIGCVFTMFLEGTFFRIWWDMLYKDHPEQQEIAGSRWDSCLKKPSVPVTCLSTPQAASSQLCRQRYVWSNPSPQHLPMEKLQMPYHPPDYEIRLLFQGHQWFVAHLVLWRKKID